MFKAKLYDEKVGFIRFIPFKSMRLAFNYVDRLKLDRVIVESETERYHCMKDSKKEWWIYRTERI